MWLEDSFDASHQCPRFGIDHKCARLHGHTYRIRIEVSGPLQMEPHGVVVDFATIKEAWQPIRDKLDHRHLNDLLGDMPTCEIILAYIVGQISMSLPGVSVIELRETEHCGATWRKANGVEVA